MTMLTTKPLKVAPSTAASISVAANVTNWVYGSWVQMIASTSAPSTVIGFVITPTPGSWASGVRLEIQIGYGGVGSEVAIGSIITHLGNSGNITDTVVVFPRPPQVVASGQRIAIRTRGISGSTFGFALLYIENYDSDVQSSGVPTYVPFGAAPTTITVNTTAWANSAWFQVVASTSIADEIVGVVVPDWVHCNTEYDIGIGGAGSEVVKTTVRMSPVINGLNNSGADGNFMQPLPIPIPVPAGSRIAVRTRQSATSGTGRDIYLLTSGGSSVAITPALAAVTQITLLQGYNEDADADVPPTTTACTGAGSVSAGSNPAAGTQILTAAEPHVYIEITPVGGTLTSYAIESIPHGVMRNGIILEMGTVKRRLADADHGYESSVITIRLSDIDGSLRVLGATLKNAIVDFWIADISTLIAGGVARRRFRGLVDAWTADTDLEFSITIVDLLTARFTSLDASDTQTPIATIDANISDQNPLENMFDKPVPEPYGSLSDEADTVPEGVWELKHVGNFTTSGLERLGNTPYFLLGKGAVKKIQSVFGADILSADPPTARIKLGASAFGDWTVHSDAFLLVPKMTDWPELTDYSIRGGVIYTLVIAKDGHPAVQQAVEGRIPFVVNVCARETVGDTSGTMMNDAANALLHWANNGLAQVSNSLWAAIASFGDYSIFDTTTFATVAARLAALSYKFAGVIGDDYTQSSWRDDLEKFCRNGGFEVGSNRHGQMIIDKLDTSATGSGAPIFNTTNILDKSVKLNHRQDAVENTIRYVYKKNYKKTLTDLTPPEGSRLFRDPEDRKWGSGIQTTTDATSITALGGDPKGIRRSVVQEYGGVRDATTASGLAVERKNRRKLSNGRPEVTFDVLLKDDNDMAHGSLCFLEHWDLPWTGSKRCRCVAIEDVFEEMVVRFTVEYVDDLLS